MVVVKLIAAWRVPPHQTSVDGTRQNGTASAASTIRPMSIVHESLALLKATGASAHHRHENDTSVQSNGSRSVGMVLVGAVLDVHSKKSWPPVCENMLLNMPVMTTVRFA